MKPLIKKTYQFFQRISKVIHQRIAYYFLEPIIKDAYVLEEVLVKGAEMSIFIDCTQLRRLNINGQKIKMSNGAFKASLI